MGGGVMDLAELQDRHRTWLQHNFPNQQPHDALLGLAEEVGELSHAHLKNQQGIREVDFRQLAEDAIGDIVIYLASYCNTNGFDLSWCVEKTWRKVSQRDWVADPQKGGEHGED
jgi:NTP pyrophosphatase (non-canonical NTP hydrolase)